MPHMSLIYGDFPASIKKEIVQKVGPELKIEFDVNSIHIIDSDPEKLIWKEIKELHLKK